jgi:hypothetical protein
MSEKISQKFQYRGSDLKLNKYKLHLQKAKYLYFNEIKSNKQIRKNSGLTNNFNIFKIRRKNKIILQRFFKKKHNRIGKQKFEKTS